MPRWASTARPSTATGEPPVPAAVLLREWAEVRARIETRTVDMHVQRLRTKLGTMGDMIETVRGFGYRFKSDKQAGSG